MLSQKRVELTKLISYVLSFAEQTTNSEELETIFPDQIKSNDEYVFNTLEPGDSRNINDLSAKIKKIMDPYIKEIIRYGINNKFNNNDLSLYASILFQLVDCYKNLSPQKQHEYILKLRDKLIIYVSNPTTIKFHGYKDELGWVKKDIVDSFVKLKTNKITLKVLADYFNINIFLFNVVDDKIYVVSGNDSYDMFRKSILLTLNGTVFEPLVYSGKGLLDNNTGPIKKMITVDRKILILLDTNLKEQLPPTFVIKLANLFKYLKDEDIEKYKGEEKGDKNKTSDNENEYEEVIPSESDANAYIKDIETTDKLDGKVNLVFNISSKMKLSEVQEVAKKLNIDVKKKGKSDGKTIAKTKKELIDEINSVLKK